MPASVVAFSIVEGGRGDPRWIQGYDCWLLLQLHLLLCEILLFYRDQFAALVQSGDCNNLHSAFSHAPRLPSSIHHLK